MNNINHIETLTDAVSPQICRALYHSVLQENLYAQGILDNKGDSIHEMKTVENKEVRYVMCGTDYRQPDVVNSIIQTLVERVVEPRYMTTVHFWEWPQLLVYPPDGGHYKPHYDGEYYFENEGWKKIADRDITMLLYLNDEYEGGEVVFPDLGITIRPKAGQVLCFPSNRHFRHGVNPVTSGERRVLVDRKSVV